MQTIQQRYEEIRNEQELTEKIDKLIVDCYHYKIFKEKASARYKKEFKDDFERDYPVYVSDITKKLASRLRGRISFYKEEEAYQAKARQQRAKRGYADTDVWNMNDWFMDTISPMLKQFRKKHNGVPSTFLPSMMCSDEEREVANAKWEQILDRMIFLTAIRLLRKSMISILNMKERYLNIEISVKKNSLNYFQSISGNYGIDI
ncbi:hypothetical protein SAMN05660484_01953 [Eubacterium ruminantium]|uniref:Uncharacterized protein n=1 Tax=Eubacterium ruminantium TaxID=42322 RepID=A0A1T4P5Z5_9FIRM|nr:hypothetical protein [Eubacterium ruminantium]SCW59185.1 hypothetical protein SAMN05660484_01953 [Eubacterium ruminantium]SDM95410.1 hypothetical protein SAMN04490370_10827 [Eubacterium ruminantium]SJZ86924.1 hypothetical protein SAMN02745110_01828 [Eubacterium ruminantium]